MKKTSPSTNIPLLSLQESDQKNCFYQGQALSGPIVIVCKGLEGACFVKKKVFFFNHVTTRTGVPWIIID